MNGVLGAGVISSVAGTTKPTTGVEVSAVGVAKSTAGVNTSAAGVPTEYLRLCAS